MTQTLLIANWKMHGSRALAAELLPEIARLAEAAEGKASVVICPPAILIPEAVRIAAGSVLAIGGQDCHAEKQGAFTGDTSATMLAEAGCRYVILGHSERRAAYRESDAMVRGKAEAAREARLMPVICVGETLAQREAGEAEKVVSCQVENSLPETGEAVLAYEPVWAIGTGKTASAEDIRAMHACIHKVCAERGRGAMTVLYGGSVKSSNAKEILATRGVGGALIGGASLSAAEFGAIIGAVG